MSMAGRCWLVKAWALGAVLLMSAGTGLAGAQFHSPICRGHAAGATGGEAGRNGGGAWQAAAGGNGRRAGEAMPG